MYASVYTTALTWMSTWKNSLVRSNFSSKGEGMGM